MHRTTPLTHERLTSLLRYEPETGNFVSVVGRGPLKQGDTVGTVNTVGYVQIQIDGRIYYGHRLAWLYMRGEWPAYEVDHMDGNRHNNAWKNLRDVPRAVNAQNFHGPRKDNKSGYLGVSQHADGKWTARIKVGAKHRYLGLFDTPELASAAYLVAKRQFHVGNQL